MSFIGNYHLLGKGVVKLVGDETRNYYSNSGMVKMESA